MEIPLVKQSVLVDSGRHVSYRLQRFENLAGAMIEQNGNRMWKRLLESLGQFTGSFG